MMVLVDLVLVVMVLGAGLLVVGAREARDAVFGFMALGLALALVWARLGAIDVALTEAAIGGGAMGVLLLKLSARLGARERRHGWRPATLVLPALAGGALAGALVLALNALPEPPPSLASAAVLNMPALGLGNAVTAVLLGFRALDTLLEKIVLLVGLLAIWSLAPDALWGGAPAPLAAPAPDGPLVLLARVLPPIGLLAGIYLVWTGADHPGGTFPGGVVLAAMWLLPMMAGLAAPPPLAARGLRAALVAGPALFLLAGFAGCLVGEGFLAYPEGFAKPIIVVVELALALSIAAIVGLMIAGRAARVPR
ncbi:MnhB domain-containing protein [Ancylobacter sp. VNQ12]|uniref:MnhB domain-containing protein n=1 Tax=Ancylobacter sp. VNQ12 TaxID=3400920 RepID=UPI003C0AE2F0